MEMQQILIKISRTCDCWLHIFFTTAEALIVSHGQALTFDLSNMPLDIN